ncbi:MAG: hypothetical protein A2014_11320 [Spirochaetes bacterium GWF1_49_6]|nr:MAG: hypothetical protein A2014_11320 [Spirochaetes bacterium GWF1_49_6]
MPVDKDIVNSMLDPFRNMVKDVDDRKLTGKDVDDMKGVMAKMEGLAQSMDDMSSYAVKLNTDGLFTAFSNAYSRALGAAAQAANAAKPPSDEEMLKQSLAAYEKSYNYLKDKPEMEYLVPPVKRAVEIAKSGVTYPVFLRMCEEELVFERMKNGEQRPALEFQLECARAMGDKLRTEMYEKQLKTYEDLSKQNPCGIADNLAFEIARQRIEWEFAPPIAEWDSILWIWDSRLLYIVHDWLDAHCSFAPFDERWRGDTTAITQYNIRRTKEKNPGRLVVWERILRAYHGIGWDDIWTHPIWQHEQAESRVWFCDGCIENMKRTYPFCKPGHKPPADVIAAEEGIYRNKAYRNPKNTARFGAEAGSGPGYKIRSFADFVKERKDKQIKTNN